MGKVSEDNTPDVRSFFEVVFESKGGWTEHVIPVRYWDDGFYQEGYLWSPGAKKDINGLVVLAAFLPLKRPSERFIFKENIYYSARNIKKVDYDDKSTSELEFTPFEPSNPVIEIDLTKENLMRFFDKYKDEFYTVAEIKSCFAQDSRKGVEKNIVTLLKSIKVEENKKLCLITSKLDTGYRLKEVKEDVSLVTLEKEDIATISNFYSDCQQCSLGTDRIARGKKIIPYGGNINSVGMIIGEAPGRQEEEQLIPFYSGAPAGGILHRVMKKVNLDLNDWFYTNTVICRPCAPEDSPTENLQPNIEQINACNTRLKRMLRSCSPKLVVILGNIAYRAFFGTSPKRLSEVLGWQTVMDNGSAVNFHIFVTYHPSFILREMNNQSKEISMKAQEGYLNHWTQIAERYKELSNAV